jgi:hypothetical protein
MRDGACVYIRRLSQCCQHHYWDQLKLSSVFNFPSYKESQLTTFCSGVFALPPDARLSLPGGVDQVLIVTKL